MDTDWDDVYTHQSTALASPEYEEREDNRQAEHTLKEHILAQVNLLHFSTVDRLIAYCVVDCLDEKGFLDAEIEEIIEAAQYLLSEAGLEEEIEADEVMVVLKHIQRLDPVGVGSKNLAECLKVQLDVLDVFTPLRNEALSLLKYYELLVSNDLNKLLKSTNLTMLQVKEAIELLKTLKPYPGLDFEAQDSDYQVPDVVVTKKINLGRYSLILTLCPNYVSIHSILI